MAEYAHPEVLVSTDWVAEHASDPNVRLVEVDVDTRAYNGAHVPGAIAWAWTTQLCDTLRRDVLSQEQFEALMSASGVSPETTLVIYGDNNNWFAAWAFWQAKTYGHKDVRLMNGAAKSGFPKAAKRRWRPHVAPHGVSRTTGRAILARLSAGGTRGLAAKIRGAGGRAQPAGIHARNPGAAGFAGDMPARRAYTGRAQHPVGQTLQ
jgi:hypothetical protein